MWVNGIKLQILPYSFDNPVLSSPDVCACDGLRRVSIMPALRAWSGI
jgi:hypothetical protein